MAMPWHSCPYRMYVTLNDSGPDVSDLCESVWNDYVAFRLRHQLILIPRVWARALYGPVRNQPLFAQNGLSRRIRSGFISNKL